MAQQSPFSVFRAADAPKTGDEVSERIGLMLAALLSAHSGTSRPAYAVAGTPWWNTSSGKLLVYDGATDQDTLFRADILGSVAQSGGSPTGDIFEVGSNANGYYERRASGWQACFITDFGSVACSTAAGNIFSSSGETAWPFPAGFASSSVVAVFANPLVDGRWASARRTSSTSSNFRHWGSASSPTGQGTSLFAIGRWF